MTSQSGAVPLQRAELLGDVWLINGSEKERENDHLHSDGSAALVRTSMGFFHRREATSPGGIFRILEKKTAVNVTVADHYHVFLHRHSHRLSPHTRCHFCLA